jgi:Family of unknown function (DUF5947)
VADRSPLIQILRGPQRDPLRSGGPETPALHPGFDAAKWPAVAERLRGFAAARATPASAERCEFCAADIDEAHGHLVDVPRRALLCVCRPCYLLFTHDGAGGARFRAVPDRYQSLPDFGAARESWDALQIPIGLAFFFVNSITGRTTAFYPSPAGATESELPLEAWTDVVRTVPALGGLAADVEALLVRRTAQHVDALIVPIDACYELVGRIRRTWRGFQGGDEVWNEIEAFFARALERAQSSAL